MRSLVLLTLALFQIHAFATSPIQMKPIDGDFTILCNLSINEGYGPAKDRKYRTAEQNFTVSKAEMQQGHYFTMTTTKKNWRAIKDRMDFEKPVLAKNLAGHKITINAQQYAYFEGPVVDGNNESVYYSVQSPVKIGGKIVKLDSTSYGSLTGGKGTTLRADTKADHFSIYLNCSAKRAAGQ